MLGDGLVTILTPEVPLPLRHDLFLAFWATDEIALALIVVQDF